MSAEASGRAPDLGGYAQALLLGALLSSGPLGEAQAHGAAAWIMRDPEHGWCCGPEDCFAIEPGEVHVAEGDYVVDRLTLHWPIAATFRSIDRRYWVCYFMRGTRFEQVKCFFAPRPPAM